MAAHEELISINPANGETVWSGKTAAPAAISAQVVRSRKALRQWAAVSLEERAAILNTFATVVKERRESLATLIAREVGKPLWEARTEVDAMAAKVGISLTAHQQRCASFGSGNSRTRFRPHGVLAVLGPYNFPGHLPNGHICPALLAGNTIIFKPSEHAPAVAEATYACWQTAGLPEDVLQLCQGGAETARALVAESGLDGVLFTGSASTGRLLARQFAETPGRILALEMGGNNPLIIDLPHLADLETAATVAAYSTFVSAGQRCTCARRLIIVESRASADFESLLIKSTRALTIGDPLGNPQPFMGPLAHPHFAEKVLTAQDKLLGLGAMPLLKAASLGPGTGFTSPAILEVSGVEGVPDEEIFGPLLQVCRAPDLETALTYANATRFGLAAGILSDDRDRYEQAAARLRAGIINWNTPLPGASSAAPFGGIGDSGNLRPSAFFAADYCSYPVASLEQDRCQKPPMPA